MKYLTLFLLLCAALASAAGGAFGQNGPPPEDVQNDERPDGGRPKLLAELGLSREQIQQIRRMNRERRPAMMDAQRRMREANRDLDVAIYRDAVGEDEFRSRLKEFQAAQSDLARLRFESELSVRRILTPEQLIRFRELRRRFGEAREQEMRDRRMRRRGGRGMPLNRENRPQSVPDQD